MTEATAAPAGAPARPRTWGLGDVALGFSSGLAGAQLALAAILSATDRTIVARVVTRAPSMSPDGTPGDVETTTNELTYELVETDDGEAWRFVTGTID